MNKLALIPVLMAAMVGCGGGGGGGGGDKGTVSFALTDAPVDTADHVVITVDKVILRRDGADDITVDRFTIPTLALINADTFQIDLLDYQNGKRVLIIDGLVVPAGTYSQLILHVLDDDVNNSYVDVGGTRTPIKLPSDELKLGGLNVAVDGVYTYTLDFDLRKSMTYNPGPNRYILKPRGMRIVSDALAATLTGAVDNTLFNSVAPCSSKVDPLAGNTAYLYQGHGFGTLADVYDPDVATGVPVGVINPYAAANVYQAGDGSWHYRFGFLPAGDYTLAFSCNAEGDFAESYDGVTIPLPSDQRVQITLTAGQQTTCNLPISGTSCAP